SGGMGVVYEAEDLKLGRHVALKFLPKNFAGDERSRRRFEQEARAASLLNHPNICTIYDIEQCEGSFFIAMELLQGEGLDARLKRGPLPLDEALQSSTEICDALEVAHKAGIIHRDLKPANLFITSHKHMKVLDFGLAKMLPAGEGGEATTIEDLTANGGVVGTVAYMSPEQASGKELDRRSDLFSLGLTLYEMVTNQRAHQGTTVALIYDSILNHAPKPPSTINPKLPAELDYVVGKALECDRDLRYQSASELRSDLKRLQRPSVVSPVPLRPRTGSIYLKRLLGALAVLVL